MYFNKNNVNILRHTYNLMREACTDIMNGEIDGQSAEEYRLIKELYAKYVNDIKLGDRNPIKQELVDYIDQVDPIVQKVLSMKVFW